MKNGLNGCSKKKKRRINPINIICWFIIPSTVIVLLVMDGLGIYCLNTERIAVFAAGILATLLPYFSEISIKNISFKKESTQTKNKKT